MDEAIDKKPEFSSKALKGQNSSAMGEAHPYKKVFLGKP
jgi:hypothetical protein